MFLCGETIINIIIVVVVVVVVGHIHMTQTLF